MTGADLTMTYYYKSSIYSLNPNPNLGRNRNRNRWLFRAKKGRLRLRLASNCSLQIRQNPL